jgi:uncharacterized protein YdhG (YjbR/CyaY superfamily)
MKKVASKGDGKKAVPAKDVDAYLARVPQDVKPVLEDLRKAIKSAAPKAEEVISYQIPTYKYHGPLVHFMAGKNHCSFVAVSESVLETFKSDLEGYKISGTTIHFSAANPLPARLVKKIVKARVKENELRAKNKQK